MPALTRTWKPLQMPMHRAAQAHELAQVGQVVADLVGEDLAGADVVAVGEAAGDGEHAVVHQALLAGLDLVDVDELGRRRRRR